MIPEFKGDLESLHVFLKRSDTFHSTLNDEGKLQFIQHLVFKLGGKAFLIFEAKVYDTWLNLKKDLLENLKVLKSTAALQNELIHLTLRSGQSAKEFADTIRAKLEEINDVTSANYENADVIRSFKAEHETVAIRTFKEGLPDPLKVRVINFNTNTLDNVVKKTVEEEPCIYNSDSIHEFQILKENYLIFRNEKKNQWNPPEPSDNHDNYYNSRQTFPQRNSPRRVVFHANNYCFDPYQHWNTYDDRSDHDGPRNRQSTLNSLVTIRQQLYCSTCHRTGHENTSCFARKDNQILNDQNVGHISKVDSLGKNPSHHRIRERDKLSWSNDLRY